MVLMPCILLLIKMQNGCNEFVKSVSLYSISRTCLRRANVFIDSERGMNKQLRYGVFEYESTYSNGNWYSHCMVFATQMRDNDRKIRCQSDD